MFPKTQSIFDRKWVLTPKNGAKWWAERISHQKPSEPENFKKNPVDRLT